MNNRNLLAYFLESKLWITYQKDIVDNIDYWWMEDYNRAVDMIDASKMGLKGYRVEDLIYDMMNCVDSSKLKSSTKKRLFVEIDDLIGYHKKEGTLKHGL